MVSYILVGIQCVVNTSPITVIINKANKLLTSFLDEKLHFKNCYVRTKTTCQSQSGQGHRYFAVECKSLISFIYTSVLLAISAGETGLHVCVFVVVRYLKEFRLALRCDIFIK